MRGSSSARHSRSADSEGRFAPALSRSRAFFFPTRTPARSTPGQTPCNIRLVPTYRVHDTTGDDLGLMEHPAPNVEPSDVVMLSDEREVLVTSQSKPSMARAPILLAVRGSCRGDRRATQMPAYAIRRHRRAIPARPSRQL